MLKKLYIFLSASAFFFIQSCSYTKHVPKGEMLLMDNDIYVNQKKGAASDAEDILKQQPNSGIWILGTFITPSLWVYNWGSGEDGKFFSKIGTAPVILDTSQVQRGAQQLRNWFFNNGYFNAQTSYNIEQIGSNSSKAEVKYYVNTGSQFYIDSMGMQVNNSRMRSLIDYHQDDRLISEGDPYNAELLDEERARLSQLFRNHGYYGFNKNYISFEADTFQTGDSVGISMIISPRQVEQGDSIVLKEHEVYNIDKVVIRPDRGYDEAGPASDTIEFRTYNIAYDSLQYAPRYLTDAIHFKKGDRYSERNVRETYSHLVGYKAFQRTEISFERNPGDSGTAPSLTAYVSLTPFEKRTFVLEPEITNTSGNIGVRGSIGWINRNFFGAGENLDVSFTAGLEYQPTTVSDELVQAFEIGTEAGISFPRFLLPVNTVGLLPKRMQPRSRVSLAFNHMTRVRRESIEFQRSTLRSQLSYMWKESLRKTHQIDLVDLAYSQLLDVSNSFFENLNPIQQRAFQSELISSSRYTFTYNEQVDPELTHFRFFRGSLELAGNTLSLIDDATSLGESTSSGMRQILNVQYFQYGKVDLDGRYYWNFGGSRSWVNRVFTGYIRPWGNSILHTDTGEVRIPPFSRYFFMGGSNDLRGWPTYRLGPGTSGNTNYQTGSDTAFATGTFKLLLNSEYRFPLISSLNAAVFIDAGNIWYTGGLQSAKTDLSWKALYHELAIGTGVGLRLDLDFFVIRFDVGAKVRDPALIDEGEQWVIYTKPFLRNLSYHIALGYPF